MNIPQQRQYPLHMPKGDYVPPIPRFALQLPKEIHDLTTVYIGVQQHDFGLSAANLGSSAAEAWGAIEKWLESCETPTISEVFEVERGYDVPKTRVWVVYYTSSAVYSAHASRLKLSQLYESLGSSRVSVGLWREHFHTPIAQLETNYSGNDYAPGLAQIAGSEQLPHKYSAYWGAARDRIPASASDTFERPTANGDTRTVQAAQSLGQYLRGTIGFDNIVHIRTGQFWARCGEEERAAYEEDLEPTLMNGLAYLHENAIETGNLGLRFLRNMTSTTDSIQEPAEPRRETCAAGFFKNLADLEQWTKRHKSHLAIYNGAHRHAKRFEGKNVMRTWHEVSVIKRDQAGFEYVNCVPDTGVIPFLPLEKVDL